MKSMICVSATFFIIAVAAVPVTKRSDTHDPNNINTIQNYEDIREPKKQEENISNPPGKRQVQGFGYDYIAGQIRGTENNYQHFNYQANAFNVNPPKQRENLPYTNNYRDVFIERDAHPQSFTHFNGNAFQQNVVDQNHYQNSPNPNAGTIGKFRFPEPQNFFGNNLVLNPTEGTPNTFNANNNFGRSALTNLGIITPNEHPGNAASYSSILHSDQQLFSTGGPERLPYRFNHIDNTRSISPENIFLVRGGGQSRINANNPPTQGKAPVVVVIPQHGVQTGTPRHPSQSLRNHQSRLVPATNVGYSAEYSEQVRPFESQPVVNTGGYNQNYNAPIFHNGAQAVQVVAADNKENSLRHNGLGGHFASIPQNIVFVDNGLARQKGTTFPANPLLAGNIIQGTNNNVGYSSGGTPEGTIFLENGWRGIVPNNVYQPQVTSSFPFAPTGYDVASNGNGNSVHPSAKSPPVLIVTSQGVPPGSPVSSNQAYRVQTAVLINAGHTQNNNSTKSNNFGGNIHPGPNYGFYSGFGNHAGGNVGSFQGVIPGTLSFGDQRGPNQNVNSFGNVYVAPPRHPLFGGAGLYNNHPINFPPLIYNDPARFSPFNQGPLIYDQINQQPVHVFNQGTPTPQNHRGIPNNLNNLVLLYSNLPLDVYQVGQNKATKDNSGDFKNIENLELKKSHGSSSQNKNVTVDKRFSESINENRHQLLIKPDTSSVPGQENIVKTSNNSEYGTRDSNREQSPSNQQILISESTRRENFPFNGHSRKFLENNHHVGEHLKPNFQVKKSIKCSKSNGKTKRSPNCNMLGILSTNERISHTDDTKLMIHYGDKLPAKFML